MHRMLALADILRLNDLIKKNRQGPFPLTDNSHINPDIGMHGASGMLTTMLASDAGSDLDFTVELFS